MRGLNELYQRSDDPFTTSFDENRARVVRLLQKSAIPGIDGSKKAAEEYYYSQVFQPIAYDLHPALARAGLQVSGLLTASFSKEHLPDDQLIDLFKKRFAVYCTSQEDIEMLRAALARGDSETRPVMTPLGLGGTALRIAGLSRHQMLNEVQQAQQFMAEAGVAEVHLDSARDFMVKALQMKPIEKHKQSIADVLDNEHGVYIGGKPELIIGPASVEDIGFQVARLRPEQIKDEFQIGATISLAALKNASRP